MEDFINYLFQLANQDLRLASPSPILDYNSNTISAKFLNSEDEEIYISGRELGSVSSLDNSGNSEPNQYSICVQINGKDFLSLNDAINTSHKTEINIALIDLRSKFFNDCGLAW